MQIYRPDIDGLRMIAVVPVVLYHAGVTWLPGGFVGVDVFFVISGFLITRILREEIEQNKFSLIGFYERRARRILPAMIPVILFVFAVAWALYPPQKFSDFSLSAIATTLFSSNVYFLIKTSNYFSSSAEFEPLLHTWSLAVEEQFYIFFPPLLWLVYRLKPKSTFQIVTILTVVSFIFACIGVYILAPVSFYMFPLRGWELGLGGLLALGFKLNLKARWLREIVSMSGLAAILVAVFFYNSATPFPGASALLPCIGATALIMAGAQGRSLATQVLSLKPIVFIGLISYSLYLWHWPILSLLRYYNKSTHLPFTHAAIAVTLSLILAYVSWVFVERPFRRRPPEGFSRIAIFNLSAAAMSFVMLISASIWVSGGLPERFPDNVALAYSGTQDRNPDKKRCLDVWPSKGLCQFGAERKPGDAIDFLMWGDSHAIAMMSGVATAARKAGKTGLFAGRAGCAPLLGVEYLGRDLLHKCAKFNAAVFAELKSQKNAPLVILAARWALAAEGRLEIENGKPVLLGWANKPEIVKSEAENNFAIYKKSLEQTVSSIRDTGRKVIVLGGVPEIGWDVPGRLAEHFLSDTKMPPAPTIESVNRRQGRAISVIANLAVPAEILFFPLAPLFCKPVCQTNIDGRPLYYDNNHLSRYGANEKIGKLFSEKIWQ